MSTDSSPPTLTRNFEIAPQDRDERQQALVRRIEQGPRGRVPVNLRAWLHNMDFAEVAEAFGLYVSQTAPLTKRQKEIVVLVHARFWDARFEWEAHVRHAQAAGITEAQIAAIQAGQVPDFDDPTERLTHELVLALHTVRHINDDLYARCMAHFGHKGVTDLIGLIGLYTMVAMTLNFYDVPPGHLPPWAARPATH